jgi:hypothetical protein
MRRRFPPKPRRFPPNLLGCAWQGAGQLNAAIMAIQASLPNEILVEANPPPTCGSLAREDLFYLLQVIDVVPGKHAHDVFDRFLPAFGMHSVLLPLPGLE